MQKIRWMVATAVTPKSPLPPPFTSFYKGEIFSSAPLTLFGKEGKGRFLIGMLPRLCNGLQIHPTSEQWARGLTQ